MRVLENGADCDGELATAITAIVEAGARALARHQVDGRRAVAVAARAGWAVLPEPFFEEGACLFIGAEIDEYIVERQRFGKGFVGLHTSNIGSLSCFVKCIIPIDLNPPL